jgi:hypothetical protein
MILSMQKLHFSSNTRQILFITLKGSYLYMRCCPVNIIELVIMQLRSPNSTCSLFCSQACSPLQPNRLPFWLKNGGRSFYTFTSKLRVHQVFSFESMRNCYDAKANTYLYNFSRFWVTCVTSA